MIDRTKMNDGLAGIPVDNRPQVSIPGDVPPGTFPPAIIATIREAMVDVIHEAVYAPDLLEVGCVADALHSLTRIQESLDIAIAFIHFTAKGQS